MTFIMGELLISKKPERFFFQGLNKISSKLNDS